MVGTALPRRSSAGNIDAQNRSSEIGGEAIRSYHDLYFDRDHRGHHGAQGRLLDPSLLVFHHHWALFPMASLVVPFGLHPKDFVTSGCTLGLPLSDTQPAGP